MLCDVLLLQKKKKSKPATPLMLATYPFCCCCLTLFQFATRSSRGGREKPGTTTCREDFDGMQVGLRCNAVRWLRPITCSGTRCHPTTQSQQ